MSMSKEEFSLNKASSEKSMNKLSEHQNLSMSFKDISGHTPITKRAHIAFKAINVFKSFVGSSILTLPFYNMQVSLRGWTDHRDPSVCHYRPIDFPVNSHDSAMRGEAPLSRARIWRSRPIDSRTRIGEYCERLHFVCQLCCVYRGSANGMFDNKPSLYRLSSASLARNQGVTRERSTSASP
jgi:hypothetical protein